MAGGFRIVLGINAGPELNGRVSLSVGHTQANLSATHVPEWRDRPVDGVKVVDDWRFMQCCKIVPVFKAVWGFHAVSASIIGASSRIACRLALLEVFKAGFGTVDQDLNGMFTGIVEASSD